MVTDMTDFEYQKENIIPLPQGRSAKVLSALYAKESIIEKRYDNNTPIKESDSLTGKELREIQKKEFENELKDIDEVDDPLNTYFKYINWIQENYPTGNDTETGLLSLLEHVLKKYQSDPRYLNDSRYLRLWFLYAHYSQEPIEIFKFLSVNEIGQNLSTYYEEYALLMETQNKYKEANEIYTLGINRKAQPIERLKKRYIEFQKRMILSVNQAAEDMDSPYKDSHKVKSSFLNSKTKSHTKRIPLQVKHVSSTASDFSYINDQNRNPNVGSANNISFTIFEDKDNPKDIKDELFGNHQKQQNQKDVFSSSEHSKHTPRRSLVLPSADETNEWTELGTRHLRRKENIRELESWKNVTIPQKASLVNSRFLNLNGGSPVSFKIYEDPEEPEHSGSEMKTPTPAKQDNNHQPLKTNNNEKSKSIDVHRCMMNMIYSLSITNLYKEIVKEKERILSRKRAGLRNERMNENLRKLDEKIFNRIKKNIDWSYNPQKNDYYNSFECKKISEFSIEEIRARYYEEGRTKNHREEEEKEVIGESSSINKIYSNSNSSTPYKNIHTPSKSILSLHHEKDDSVTNRTPPFKKSKSLSEMNNSSTVNSNTNCNNNNNNNNVNINIKSSNLKNNDIMKNHTNSYGQHDEENKENQMKEDLHDNFEKDEDEGEETRYTVKQDLKLFIPHDLSSETFSPPSIPRTQLLTKNALNANISSSSSSPSPSQPHTTKFLQKLIQEKSTTTSTSQKAIATAYTMKTTANSSSTINSTPKNKMILSTPKKLNLTSPSLLQSTPSRISSKSNSSSSTTLLDYSSHITTTPVSNSNRPLFRMVDSPSTYINTTPSNSGKKDNILSRQDTFHIRNSPTVTIYTKNAYAVVNEWFNEPCDEENMNNLYRDHTLTISDIDNTFFLKKKNKK